jgi:predicted nucleic acid-binding protein
MNFFWLDASALVKRYLAEIGTPLMNHLFTQVPPQQMVCLLEGVGEVISVLIRRRNGGAISKAACQQSLTALRTEIIHQADVEKVERTSQQVVNSWPLLDQHSLNSTDALILRCALDYAANLRRAGFDLVLVSADTRLVRAAKLEGLQTIHPEMDDLLVVDSFI